MSHEVGRPTKLRGRIFSLVRASDGRAILLPTLWRSNTPFAIGDEVATVAFLRHFG